VEYQGTFPLPEAQMDRFALSFSLGYPSAAEELQMLQRLQQNISIEELQPCIALAEVKELRRLCMQIRVEPPLQQYILDIVRSTRQHEEIRLGVSPRGTVALYKAAQALALLENRTYTLPDDVKFLAPFVLAHRLIPKGGQSAQFIVNQLLQTIAVP
jgi:MoxR-like ATPase